MNGSRRRFFKTAFISTALLSLPRPLLAASRKPLYIPPLVESRRGKPVFLGAQSIQAALAEGKSIDLWGFTGMYLGPTVKVKQGDFVKLNYRNNLSQTVALHVQGLQVSGELIGGVTRHLQAGQSWAPIVPITQSAATCYYHACTLGNSAYQTYRGLAGMWIIEDDETRQSTLPQKYAANDIPLILQDMQLNNSGTQLFNPSDMHLRGNRLFVNGQEAPYLNVQRGWVRLRILNASLSRTYQLGFEDERTMKLIANGQGFLAESQTLNRISLVPGARAEILVDLSDGEHATLIAGNKRNLLDKIGLFFDADGELADNTVLELRPEGLVSVFNQQPAFRSLNIPVLPSKNEVVRTRQFHLDTANALLNQKRFDPRQIDVYAKHGSFERWTISSTSPTGFRIQGAKFIVERVNEQATEPAQLAWQDTVQVENQVQLLVKFDNLSSNMQPFIFGSSDLMQADKGALGLIVVQ